MKKLVSIFLCASMVLIVPGCSSMSKLAEGTLVGGGVGATVGAGVGAIAGKDGKSTAIGAAIGTVVGAGVGAIIGRKMDKKAAELAAIEAAQVETVEDANGLEAIKVTFDSGILFDFNTSTLNASSKESLKQFAAQMVDLPDTDITIYGHTDNIGTAAANEKVSLQRAEAVEKYLKSCGIAKERMTAEGKSFTMPVASNDTEAGRAQNRRVEIYITANKDMIEAAAAEAK